MSRHEIITTAGNLPVFFNCYTESNQLIPSHWHQHIEMLCVTEGTMDITMNNNVYRVRPGDIFIINSSVIHSTQIREATTNILLQIPYEMLWDAIDDIDHIHFKAYLPYDMVAKSEQQSKLRDLLLAMRDIFVAKEKGYAFLFNSSLHQLLHSLYLHFGEPFDPKLNLTVSDKHLTHLQKAIDYIESNYKEAISLKEIASHLALNPEYFCRLFKRHMGFTFLEYLNQIRLTHIYDELMASSDSIAVIQERNGFTNYKVFNRMFQASYGCTPSQARRKRT